MNRPEHHGEGRYPRPWLARGFDLVVVALCAAAGVALVWLVVR